MFSVDFAAGRPEVSASWKVASVVSRPQTTAGRGCAQHPGEEIQSLRERTRWTADTVVHRGAYNVTPEKCSWHDIHIPVYYPTLASLRRIKIPTLQSRPPPKEHVTILIEARRNSDGSGATTSNFTDVIPSRWIALKRVVNISRLRFLRGKENEKERDPKCTDSVNGDSAICSLTTSCSSPRYPGWLPR